MKKYKTSEVIAMLEKNPKLKFKAVKHNKGEFIEVVDNRVCWGGDWNYPIYILVNAEQEEWELIQQPISFMEAVKAYSEGKTIKCEANGCKYIFNAKRHRSVTGQGIWLRSDTDVIPSTEMILNGTWYVEESNE